MKSTGIVRRIDDIGRVAIPKEICRTMHISEGDPLEIYAGKDGEITFKKYKVFKGIQWQIEETMKYIREDSYISLEKRKAALKLLDEAAKIMQEDTPCDC